MSQGKLILLRHGQSTWNAQKRFAGWVNVPLNDIGREEAARAAQVIKNYSIDYVVTSILVRAIETASIVMDELNRTKITIMRTAAINERSYGDLEGFTHKEAEEKFGVEQVKKWRRSRYEQPPHGESLQNTYDRVIPYFENNIVPLFAQGKTVLVVAHGNSLRALVMYLHAMSDEEIEKFSIPTAQPILYTIPSSYAQLGRYALL